MKNMQIAESGLLSNLFLTGYCYDVPEYGVEAFDRVITDRVLDEIYDYLVEKHGEGNFILEVFR